MYLTVKQQVKHLSKEEYRTLRELCHTAKNLANAAIYNVRQYYFAEGKYLRYEDNYALLRDSPEYRFLRARTAQKNLKEVNGEGDQVRDRRICKGGRAGEKYELCVRRYI